MKKQLPGRFGYGPEKRSRSRKPRFTCGNVLSVTLPESRRLALYVRDIPVEEGSNFLYILRFLE